MIFIIISIVILIIIIIIGIIAYLLYEYIMKFLENYKNINHKLKNPKYNPPGPIPQVSTPDLQIASQPDDPTSSSGNSSLPQPPKVNPKLSKPEEDPELKNFLKEAIQILSMIGRDVVIKGIVKVAQKILARRARQRFFEKIGKDELEKLGVKSEKLLSREAFKELAEKMTRKAAEEGLDDAGKALAKKIAEQAAAGAMTGPIGPFVDGAMAGFDMLSMSLDIMDAGGYEANYKTNSFYKSITKKSRDKFIELFAQDNISAPIINGPITSKDTSLISSQVEYESIKLLKNEYSELEQNVMSQVEVGTIQYYLTYTNGTFVKDSNGNFVKNPNFENEVSNALKLPSSFNLDEFSTNLSNNMTQQMCDTKDGLMIEQDQEKYCMYKKEDCKSIQDGGKAYNWIQYYDSSTGEWNWGLGTGPEDNYVEWQDNKCVTASSMVKKMCNNAVGPNSVKGEKGIIGLNYLQEQGICDITPDYCDMYNAEYIPYDSDVEGPTCKLSTGANIMQSMFGTTITDGLNQVFNLDQYKSCPENMPVNAIPYLCNKPIPFIAGLPGLPKASLNLSNYISTGEGTILSAAENLPLNSTGEGTILSSVGKTLDNIQEGLEGLLKSIGIPIQLIPIIIKEIEEEAGGSFPEAYLPDCPPKNELGQNVMFGKGAECIYYPTIKEGSEFMPNIPAKYRNCPEINSTGESLKFPTQAMVDSGLQFGYCIYTPEINMQTQYNIGTNTWNTIESDANYASSFIEGLGTAIVKGLQEAEADVNKGVQAALKEAEKLHKEYDTAVNTAIDSINNAENKINKTKQNVNKNFDTYRDAVADQNAPAAVKLVEDAGLDAGQAVADGALDTATDVLKGTSAFLQWTEGFDNIEYFGNSNQDEKNFANAAGNPWTSTFNAKAFSETGKGLHAAGQSLLEDGTNSITSGISSAEYTGKSICELTWGKNNCEPCNIPIPTSYCAKCDVQYNSQYERLQNGAFSTDVCIKGNGSSITNTFYCDDASKTELCISAIGAKCYEPCEQIYGENYTRDPFTCTCSLGGFSAVRESCKEGYINDGLMCTPACPDNYKNVLGLCFAECPGDMISNAEGQYESIDLGLMCTRPRKIQFSYSKKGIVNTLKSDWTMLKSAVDSGVSTIEQYASPCNLASTATTVALTTALSAFTGGPISAITRKVIKKILFQVLKKTALSEIRNLLISDLISCMDSALFHITTEMVTDPSTGNNITLVDEINKIVHSLGDTSFDIGVLICALTSTYAKAAITLFIGFLLSHFLGIPFNGKSLSVNVIASFIIYIYGNGVCSVPPPILCEFWAVIQTLIPELKDVQIPVYNYNSKDFDFPNTHSLCEEVQIPPQVARVCGGNADAAQGLNTFCANR